MNQGKDTSDKSGEPEIPQVQPSPENAPVSGFSLVLTLLALFLLGIVFYFLMRGEPNETSIDKTYNLDDLQKTAPNTILFNELKPIPSGFKEPTCIATGSDNRIYAGGDRQIRIFDSDGKKTGEIELQNQPTCIAVSGNNDIFVGFPLQVSVFNPAGKETVSWKFETGSAITGIAVSGKNVFIADAGKKMVHVKDLDSPEKEEFRIGVANKETGDDGIVIYSAYMDVATDGNDLLMVVDPGRHRLKLYSYSGGLVSTWKSNPDIDMKGFSGCCNPSHIAICPPGKVVTSEKSIPRIKLYSATGDFVGVVAPPESFKPGQMPCDISVDKKGIVYAIDPATGNIRIFKEK
ncbi:MAG TPA: hypothetical protein DCZ94_03595 [Lentisphaeria bacterium]|nr:MAG: hypothetical protein A2X48_02220 [Lentisphaerae bacterium GWF2_49_21]HBC86017.1 hypothetical protein [Lentisphaeria bacterium]